MKLFYKIAYQIGITPWEDASKTHGHLISSLLERERSDRQPPYGRALDLGCGTGLWTVALAKQGWDVVGIDIISKALQKARKRAEDANVDVHLVQGDVTALRDTDVGTGFRFLLDLGCFHGLSDKQREAMGHSINAVAAPGATLLELVWTPARRGPLPRGASPDELEHFFPGWEIINQDPLDAEALPGFLKNADPRCYRLRKSKI